MMEPTNCLGAEQSNPLHRSAKKNCLFAFP
uniref:Uncharacterized protein n=1 Tax=Rhizophora mucronata TaxID=61149 RepID=A0A2P2IRJ9_RHIMU